MNAFVAKGGKMAIRLTRKPITQKHRPSKRVSIRVAKRLRLLVMAGCITTIVSSSGCNIVGNACKLVKRGNRLDDCMIGYRNSVLAAKAWHNEKHCFKNRRHVNDYKAGFMKGYADVATGSDGCVPAVAPQEYLGWRYQSPDGQQSVNAWFAGYPLGVRAAERDGVGNWGQIRPMGRNTSQAITNQYQPYVPDPTPESPFYEEPSTPPLPQVDPSSSPATGSAGDMNLEPSSQDPPLPVDAGDSMIEPDIPSLDSARDVMDLPDSFGSVPGGSIPSASVGDTPIGDTGAVSETITDQGELPFSFE